MRTAPAAGQGTVAPVGITPDPRFPHRLQNTTRTLAELGPDDQAILLRNALLDTATGVPLALPAHLKSSGDPGSYIVQAHGPIDDAFRRTLAAVGARIVSFIPNNAYLVRMDSAQAGQMAAFPGTQSVLPFEPYFKLDSSLLALAVEQKPLPEGKELVLALFADSQETTMKDLQAVGATVVKQDRSPFGPLVYVKAPPESLPILAQMSGVQGIEEARTRGLMNDLARVALNVAPDTLVSNNFLGLTGSNVVVNVNDTGVDPDHPDLAGRVLIAPPSPPDDPSGHGTHVAGTIASTGTNSFTVTNAVGSLTNASYRGIAPAAKIFPLRVFLLTGPEISDAFLQETAAATNMTVFGRTNAIISNNSWGYIADTSYNFATAGYDASVRDALPAVPGEQPVLYVFAAGNNGFGEDNGQGGIPGTVSAPATGKNVISVAASENGRGITNETWAPFTDSSDQIASFSSRGNAGIGVEGPNGRFKPDITAPGTFIVSTRSAGWTSNSGDDLDALNEVLGPHYRYESGTSMAAPAISGMLALMQEFFEHVLKRDYSPALFKALLINGARSIGTLYDLSPQAYANFQGWGLANLTNSLPTALTNATSEADWPIRFIDESPTNALTTGQSRSWRLNLTEQAQLGALRITLAWTDPPGNPAASIKLVNDLDLVVTNLDTGEVYVGNNIRESNDFNSPNATNELPGGVIGQPTDYVNNVENVFLREALGTNFVVSVIARRVNVNAIDSNTNSVVQDFALVISSSVEPGAKAFTDFEFDPLISAGFTEPPITTFTNGVPLLFQHVGANFPLSNTTQGDVLQWRFYLFDNSMPPSELSGLTNGSNVAFITFIPPNLSKARNFDADIDLYVSKDASLTNLNPVALASAVKSLNSGGTEVVFFTNATLSDIFYVAVKAEDQMASEFGIVGLSTDIPFDEEDEDGNHTLNGLPPAVNLQDGSPELPSASYQFAIATSPYEIALAVVTNVIFHESVGDLYGHFSHGNTFAVLNNHRAGDDPTNTLHTFIYDDTESGSYGGADKVDGPGSLANLVGEEAFGLPFILAMADNALNQTGRVEVFKVRIEAKPPLEEGYDFTILPGGWLLDRIEVPINASKLTIFLSNLSGPVNVYLRQGQRPTASEYDKFALINPTSGALSIGLRDVPPLSPGPWFIGVFNPGSVPVSGHIQAVLELSVGSALTQTYTSLGGPFGILDDALSRFTLSVTNPRPVADLSVGLRIEHERAADLSIRLTSPLGRRTLLVENRGGLSTNGFGYGRETNIIYTGFTDNTNLSAGPIKFAVPPFAAETVLFTNHVSGFEVFLATNYNAGASVDGWRVLTNQIGATTYTNVKVLQLGAQAHGGVNALSLEGGAIQRVLPTAAGTRYLLSFYYASSVPAVVESALILGDPAGVVVSNATIATSSTSWQQMVLEFDAPTNGTPLEIRATAAFPATMLLDDFTLVEFSRTKFYTPEEPFSVVGETLFDAGFGTVIPAILGSPALGDWRLDIVDSRAGPASTSELLSWQLNFVFAPTNPPAITLTNGIPYAGTITNGDIQYFIVDVPRSASLATNILTPTGSGDLALLYNESGLPDGLQSGDVTIDFGRGGDPEVLILDTNLPPKLNPGQRYYLGVKHSFFQPTGTSDYTLLVQFDRTDTNLLIVPILANGVARSASIGVTNVMDYYQFDVSASAEEVLFELVPNGGNANLFARKLSPGAANPLPTPTLYDYASRNRGTNRESILVTTNSFPVPLASGIWYVGVLNVDTQAVAYTIKATEFSGAGSNFVPIADGVPLTSTNALATQLTTIFQLHLDTTNPAVQIQLSGLNDPARLHVDLDRVPRPGRALASMDASPGQVATLILRTNAFLPSLNGDLNIVVEGLGTTDLRFTLVATTLADGAPPIVDLPGATDTVGRVAYSPLEPEIDYYRFVASADVRWIDVELAPADGNVDLVLRRDLPLPTAVFYSYTSANLGLTNDSIRVSRLSLPDPADAGDWYIGVVNREQRSVTYSLRATETPNDAVITLFSGEPLDNVVLARGVDYYRLPISAEATRASVQVNVFGSTGIQELESFLKQGLPLPFSGDYDYQPFVFGQTQLFQVDTNTVPVPLAAGDWHLAVGNATDFAVSYQVTFAESTNDLALSTNLVAAIVYQTPGNTVIAWYAEAGQDYYVEGSTNNASGPWTPVSGTIQPVGNQGQRTLPLDTPYLFFRVVKGAAPDLILATPKPLPDGSLQLDWNGYIGGSYDVLFSSDLSGWTLYTNVVATAETGSITIPPSAQASAYYRIYLQP